MTTADEAPAYQFRSWYIPARMMGGIRRYIEAHVAPGDFLCAVIRNDLRGAVECADDENLANVPAFVAYFYNDAPARCWGSREAFDAWIAERKVSNGD